MIYKGHKNELCVTLWFLDILKKYMDICFPIKFFLLWLNPTCSLDWPDIHFYPCASVTHKDTVCIFRFIFRLEVTMFLHTGTTCGIIKAIRAVELWLVMCRLMANISPWQNNTPHKNTLLWQLNTWVLQWWIIAEPTHKIREQLKWPFCPGDCEKLSHNRYIYV